MGAGALFPDERKKQHYGTLFFLLQTEPQHLAHLVTLVNLSEMDGLMQCVMFTLYGNQYEPREEGLLLTMFQVERFLSFFPCFFLCITFRIL